MTNQHEAWSALRHGGNLLSPNALEKLPSVATTPFDLKDRLRDVLVKLSAEEKASSPLLGEMLDVILETACGLKSGWLKGNALAASEGVKLLDGTTLKPRRLLRTQKNTQLVVFTYETSRLGVGKGRRIVAQVVEYLRRTHYPLALVTNGKQWRLIWADIDSLAWAEWDAERWLQGDHISEELQLLRRILSMGSLLPDQSASSPLLSAIQETRKGQAKLSKELGERVRRAVETLLRSRQPILAAAWDEHQNDSLYVAASHFVMRLVVTLFAEARELLPIDNPLYYKTYSLRGLLDQFDRLSHERRRQQHSAWPRLLALFRLLHQGSPHPAMLLPAYGGDLFRAGSSEGDSVQRALSLIESLETPPHDDVICQILLLLTRTNQKIQEGSQSRIVAAPVDFTELTSEYIGILYEGLLDYELHKAGQHPVVFLNLGDQPALPLDRLEAMDDKTLKGLVEKAKVQKKTTSEESDNPEDEDENEDEEPTEDDGEADPIDQENQKEEAFEQEESSDDLRQQARTRADAWACRAVEVAKLVKKPKSKHTQALAAYQEQVQTAAKQLIADLKLPNELYLVRWGGTRKGAGTFYTRPQLTLPTVRKTLEPLLYNESKQIRSPEDLLALKICDPAMGSGSFLVAALRILTAAVIESLHQHNRIQQQNGKTLVKCELFSPEDRKLNTRDFDERLEAIVRRAVVEFCLYGVDLDPLAVELARVALWVETLDQRLPFTFLDHKLRCGNALVGTWLDRFRDYPLLAFDRQSPDYKREGVHLPANQWHNALQAKRKQAIAEQVDVITSQLALYEKAQSNEEIQQALDRTRQLYHDLHVISASRPDERAKLWRDRIQKDTSFQKVRQAFDTWCSIWFWPLEQLELIPLPENFYTLDLSTQNIVRQLQQQKRFFHWELEFPDVFTEEHAGFDAIVGNPPWETLQPESKEFFSNYDPLYRSYGKQRALEAQEELFARERFIEENWLRYNGAFKDLSNWLKNVAEPFGDAKVSGHEGSPITLTRGSRNEELHDSWKKKRQNKRGNSDPSHVFQRQGDGKAYTYKMFAELAYSLIRKNGQLGLITPSGIYTDKGTMALRKLFLQHGRWRWLYGFENRNKLFDIDSRFKFCILIVEKGGQTDAISVAFMRHDLEDWGQETAVLRYPAERIASFSPKSLSILEIRSPKDLDILTKIYNNGILLGDETSSGWGIKYTQGDFNMTSDSKLFIQRDKAEADGYKPDLYGRWINEEGEILLPLYEGRMIGQFDFSEKGWVSGKGRSAVWRDIPWEEKKIEPQYLVSGVNFTPSCQKSEGRVVFMDVTSSTNKRTMISAFIPLLPCGNKVPILETAKSKPLLNSVLDGLIFDWQLRQRLGGITLNFFIMEETALPKRTLSRKTEQLAEKLVVKLTAIAWSYIEILPNYYTKKKHPQEHWAITPQERLRLRCMLDAMVAVLYGLDRTDFAWILRDCDHSAANLSEKAFCRTLDPKGFWRVDKDKSPELRHTVLSLVAFDDLQAKIQAHNNNQDDGIKAFCEQNNGEGWMLPETLCLRDLGMTRSVAIETYDECACTAQPVRSRMGERFLDWQLAQTPEESWAECEQHARILSASLGLENKEDATNEPATTPKKKSALPEEQNLAPDEPHASSVIPRDLLGHPLEVDLFGNIVETPKKRRK